MTRTGVFKPTVPEVAKRCETGQRRRRDCLERDGRQYPELEAVRTEELDRGTAHITIAVMRSSKTPTAALKFARYLAARDRGLKQFAKTGYEPVDGDIWRKCPKSPSSPARSTAALWSDYQQLPAARRRGG